MRLFVALGLPVAALEEAAAWWPAACVHLPVGQWRDIPRRNWHLTLAFYGETSGNCVDALADTLAECAFRTPCLKLHFRGFGVFPGLQRPNVFWLGVQEDAGHSGLKKLARCCRQAGRATVRKQTAREPPFRGHITMARRRGYPVPLTAEAIAQMPEAPDISWQAKTLRLYRSELHRDGARYFVLEEFTLAGKAAERGDYVR